MQSPMGALWGTVPGLGRRRMLSNSAAMADARLKDVDVILLEQHVNVRRVIKYTLNEVGFKNLHECSDAKEASIMIKVHRPDVLLFDLDSDPEAVCAIISDVRHHRLGTDPFMVIIVTTWRPDTETIRRALGCGVDDIVTKPISVQILSRRIDNLIHRRKEFVATNDYFGPDRRDERRRSPDAPPLIQVPNSLRHKAIGDASAVVDEETIQRAMESMLLQKIQRVSIEVTHQIQQLEAMVSAHSSPARVSERIAKTASLVTDVVEYCTQRQVRGLMEIAASMQRVLEAIQRVEMPALRQLEVLRLHSQAVSAGLLEKEGAAEAVASALRQATSKVGVATDDSPSFSAAS